MNRKFYGLVVSVFVIVLMFGSLALCNKYIDDYNDKRLSEGMNVETGNFILSETGLNNIHLNMEMEVTAFNNNHTCQLKDVVHPGTMYLVLTVPMRIWDHRSFDLINQLKTEKRNIPCVQVIILGYGTTLRDMRVKISSFKELPPFYMTPLADIGLPAVKPNNAYLIFTDDGKSAIHSISFEHGSTQYLTEFIGKLAGKYCEKTNRLIEDIEGK